jgi:hypothetical protein
MVAQELQALSVMLSTFPTIPKEAGILTSKIRDKL